MQDRELPTIRFLRMWKTASGQLYTYQDNDIQTKVVQGLLSHNVERSAWQIERFFSEQIFFRKLLKTFAVYINVRKEMFIMKWKWNEKSSIRNPVKKCIQYIPIVNSIEVQ